MSVRKLSQLKVGEGGRITEVANESPEKLYEMGFLPGSEVRLKQIAPFGDPLHIVVDGYDIALRIEEANWVFVDSQASNPEGA